MALPVDTRTTSAAVQSAVRLGESTSKLAVSVSDASTKAATEATTGAVLMERTTAILTIGKSKPEKNPS